MKTSVLGFVFDERNLLLVRRRRPPHEGRFNAPGGPVREGEAPHEAVSREVEEEVGVRIPPDEWRLRLTVEKDGETVFIFAAFGNVNGASACDQNPIKLPVLGTDWRREPLAYPDLRWIIPFVLDPEFAPATVRKA
jgi:ADP-ribose pyrophosphatase YjhB (NUDIX family)